MSTNRILIIGSGGREHALAWKLAQSELVSHVFVAPGNAGTVHEKKCENVPLNSIEEFIDFAKKNQIDLTIVGPEAFLVDGIADRFIENNLAIFAPNQKAAQLEGSKAFAKAFMDKYGVKTAKFDQFCNEKHAKEYLNMMTYPVVVKASGLAAGKGVVICQNHIEAHQTIDDMLLNESFGDAGSEIVIEEYLDGFEASILTICDGKTVLPFVSAKDHKKIGEGETGLNTGGMGVIAPNPEFTEAHFNEFLDDIVTPTLVGLKQEHIDFVGVIFFGLMINRDGVFLLEYNVRFGDPETQAVLPLMDSDLYPVLQSAISGKLDDESITWKQESSCCVVAVSGGYPEAYEKGKVITFTEPIEQSKVFIAGAIIENNQLITSGGRVLSVVNTSSTLDKATIQAYQDLQKIQFDKMYFRKDIGL